MILFRSILCSVLVAAALSLIRRRKSRNSKSSPSDYSDASSGRQYEVFLSFRGPDTRLTFTDSLHAALVRAGIRVFRDDNELRVGEEFGGELLGAIAHSKIYVPIFSRGYAASKWCLRELASMVECRKRNERVVFLPVFYDVEASDVMLETGQYREALQEHERESGEEVARKWEDALREVAGIPGRNLRDHGQDKLVRLITEEVASKLRIIQPNLHDDLVGIDDRMEDLIELIGLASSGVRFVIIHGMGGIGKTTLAKAVFKQMSSQFQSCSFLSDMRQSSGDNDILDLQKKLLCDILDLRSVKVSDTNDGIEMMKERFCGKKILIVLDDVDKRDQLMKLAGKSSWFGAGSRIIVTTRNIHFLATDTENPNDIIRAHSKDFYFYEVKEMQFDHALQLFSKHAFESESPPHDFYGISKEVVNATGRLPLTLEVIGSYLHCKGKVIWKDKLKKLRQVPDKDVQKKLMISYEELEYEQQQIFLDIACYFIGEEVMHPHYMWKACEFFPKSGVLVLVHLSLVKIVDDDILWMHDQLRDLGREIVRSECLQISGKQSRLWRSTVALEVVQFNEGTENVVALKLTGLPNLPDLTSEQFSRLLNLRFLELDGGNLVGEFEHLLSKLKWLSWHHCPSELHANNLCLKNLAVLKLSDSNVTEDWAGWEACMVNGKLKVMHLTGCKRLIRTPNFSTCLDLKMLVIKDCEKLKQIDSSIGKLERLKCLEISGKNSLFRWQFPKRRNMFVVPSVLDSIGGLKSLLMLKIENDQVQELPHSIGELSGLEYLSLSHCPVLERLPNSIGELKSLLRLDLSVSGIIELPESIGGLESLVEMNISNTEITKLPDSIGNLKRLKVMDMHGTQIRAIPDSIGGLESLLKLDLHETCITELPESIGNLNRLEAIDLFDSKLRELPESIGGLESLLELDLYETNVAQLPDSIRTLKRLKRMKIGNKIRELTEAIGMLTNLKEICASGEMEEIPSEIGQLSLLRILDLSRSKVTRLPITIGQLSHLQKLHLLNCNGLQMLPELPATLTVLECSSSSLQTLPDLSKLTKLVYIDITNYIDESLGVAQGPVQSQKIGWIGRLFKLEYMVLIFPNLTLPPTNLSSLSLLRQLTITCLNPQSMTRLPSSLEELTLYDVKSPLEWSLFSNLRNLSGLNLCRCWLREIQFHDGLGQLENLHHLELSACKLLARLSSLSSLKKLQVLSVRRCPLLREMQGLEDLEFLETLSIEDCSSLEGLPDLSNSQKLQKVTILCCELLQDRTVLSPANCKVHKCSSRWELYKEERRTTRRSEEADGQLSSGLF
ncbi:uncharacterized protein J3R85_020989 [Psidium guajava]|nr:uncharacterized protein J3R85_020989 [Psidium guajava]